LSNQHIFETDRLLVRQYEFDRDTENFFLLNGDEEVVRYIRPAKTREECDAFLLKIIESVKANPLMGRWAVDDKLTGEFIGSFSFLPIEGTEDNHLGYALLKKNWGKGYATELMREGIKYVFTKTSLNEVYGITESANIASKNVLTKVGFILHEIYMEEEKEIKKFILYRR